MFNDLTIWKRAKRVARDPPALVQTTTGAQRSAGRHRGATAVVRQTYFSRGRDREAHGVKVGRVWTGAPHWQKPPPLLPGPYPVHPQPCPPPTLPPLPPTPSPSPEGTAAPVAVTRRALRANPPPTCSLAPRPTGVGHGPDDVDAPPVRRGDRPRPPPPGAPTHKRPSASTEPAQACASDGVDALPPPHPSSSVGGTGCCPRERSASLA